MATPPRPNFTQLLGLFLVSCATLLLQVTWTRVLSVSLYYHFAFLVVSTALLGFGVSGVLLAVSRRLARIDLRRGLSMASGGMTISVVVGFLLANRIPFAPFSLLSDTAQLVYAPLYLLCIAAPFMFCGICVALLFSRMPAHAGRIYFVDLLGAGVGCLAIVVVMPVMGGSGSVVVSAALAGAGTICFSRGRGRLVFAACTLGLALLTFTADSWLPIRISHTKVGKGGAPIEREIHGPKNLHTAWNTFSRIDVLPAPWGRKILIDAGTAMTRMPRINKPLQELGPIADERRLVFAADQSVLIIGSGGGWEVLAALRSGARKVVAVEINPLINELVAGPMAEYVGGIFRDPRVELHTAEARSFIRRRSDRYDLIMASHTISNAATASGALSLAESYILTIEAFADYLDHLTPGGALWLSRPEAQLPRLLATAREALARRGVKDPRRHLIAFAGRRSPSFYGAMILRLKPFSDADVDQAVAQLRTSGLRGLYLPGAAAGPALYRSLVRSAPDRLPDLYRTHPTQIAPATDDRPFFNQRHRWSSIDMDAITRVFTQRRRGRMALEDQPVSEVTLLVVLIQSALMAVLLVIAPLLWRRREGLQGPPSLLLYFLCLGLGFILCEIGLIQRLTLFLGQPVTTFAVVVGVLLVSSGVGSLLSEKVAPDTAQIPRRLPVVLGIIAALILVFSMVSPGILRACLQFSLWIRVLITFLMLFPLGLGLGMAFPLGLRVTGQVAPGMIPWAWGLNAVASVVGSVTAIILATLIGFSGVFQVAAGVYVLALLLWISRGRLAPQANSTVD